MEIYHYDSHDKFYLYKDTVPDLSQDSIQKGEGLPSSATYIRPPFEDCTDGFIPVFEDGKWVIKADIFWHRKPHIEVNFDAGRKASTLDCKDYEFVFPHFRDWPQLCNTVLVRFRCIQGIRIIYQKFRDLIRLHDSFKSGNGSLNNDSCLVPSPIYMYKFESESFVFLMRRILDSIVQMMWVELEFSKFQHKHKIECESIGSLLTKHKDSQLYKIFCGDEFYEKGNECFLGVINDLFNAFKHSVIHDETMSLIGSEWPTIVCLYAKYANYDDQLQYHNHNAYHILMGFQDCLDRIFKNYELYKQQLKRDD